jgi:hypothetical protein
VDLWSAAVISVGRPVRGIVFREGNFDFRAVVLVAFDVRRVVVPGTVSRMTARGKNRTRADDYQSCQDNIPCGRRHGSQDWMSRVGCPTVSVVRVVEIDRERFWFEFGPFNHSLSCHVG